MSLDLMGATVEFLAAPSDGEPCVMRGVIPPGVIVPLHAHRDPETFFMTEGEIEAHTDGEWARIGPGDVLHVPGHAGHAFRNRSSAPARMYIVSTATIGRFFREIDGRRVEEFEAISERYGYWNATPEENAAIGLSL